MRPQVKTSILISVLGLSLAFNASLAIGHLRGPDESVSLSVDSGKAERFCLLDRLDLDSGQRQRLAEMRGKMQARRAEYWKQTNIIKAELAEAICYPDADREALDKLLNRYAKNQASMQRAVADHLLGVNAMLRPDQRKEFRKLLRSEMFRGIRSMSSGVLDRP